MSRPPFVVHWKDVLSADDARYPGSDELHSIGAPLGKATGLARVGVHYELLPPGRRTSFPHAERDEEELVFVLEGAPDVWIDGETFRLGEGDAVGFPSGTGIAHTFINDTETDVRLLVVGERRPGAAVFYPLHQELNERLGEKRWDDVPPRARGPHDGRPRAPASPERGLVPTLETERLVLRKLSMEDVGMRVAMRGDPEHMRFLLVRPTSDPEAARARLAFILRDMTLGNSKGWAIVRKDDGAVIGNTGIIRIDWEHRRASLAYELVKTARGEGLAREAAARAVRFAFEEMGLVRVQAEIDPRNERSLAVVKALGFTFEGVLRANQQFEGESFDDAIWSKLAKD